MKTLLVLRHGKSDWEDPSGVDHDRPLAKRGIHAARQMGRFLQQIGQVPDIVLSSTAARARRTAELAIDAGNWQSSTENIDSLYDASVDSVLDLIEMQDDSLSRVLLVGHQPTLSGLIGQLTGGAEVRFPTAAMARIDIITQYWEEIRAAQGQLIWLVTPKLLASAGRAK